MSLMVYIMNFSTHQWCPFFLISWISRHFLSLLRFWWWTHQCRAWIWNLMVTKCWCSCIRPSNNRLSNWKIINYRLRSGNLLSNPFILTFILISISIVLFMKLPYCLRLQFWTQAHIIGRRCISFRTCHLKLTFSGQTSSNTCQSCW